MSVMSSRHCTIRFKRTETGASTAAITRAVRAIAGIDSADYYDGNLSVSYQFPETTLATILQTIRPGNVQVLLQPLNRIKNLMLAFMEENERDYCTYTCGWHRYLEDMYRRYYNNGMHDRIDIRKQTWRKYK